MALRTADGGRIAALHTGVKRMQKLKVLPFPLRNSCGVGEEAEIQIQQQPRTDFLGAMGDNRRSHKLARNGTAGQLLVRSGIYRRLSKDSHLRRAISHMTPPPSFCASIKDGQRTFARASEIGSVLPPNVPYDGFPESIFDCPQPFASSARTMKCNRDSTEALALIWRSG